VSGAIHRTAIDSPKVDPPKETLQVFIYTLPVAAVSVGNGFMMVANEKVCI